MMSLNKKSILSAQEFKRYLADLFVVLIVLAIMASVTILSAIHSDNLEAERKMAAEKAKADPNAISCSMSTQHHGWALDSKIKTAITEAVTSACVTKARNNGKVSCETFYDFTPGDALNTTTVTVVCRR